MLGSSVVLMSIRLCRRYSHRWLSSKQLMYGNYGHPPDVLQLTEKEVDKIGADEVRIRWMGAPINPSDINQLQGLYPIKPSLPAVGGNEGFGEVEEVGNQVTTFHIGDWVVPGSSGVGSWRTVGKHRERDLLKSLKIYPSIQRLHFRMLKDFVDLKAGDLVVQNGANSNVGRCLCKLWDIRTINVVRNRENLNALVRELKEIGADEAKSAQLALNCVGGRSALMLSTCLSMKGVMVTYGGMSKKPVPTGPLIFNDIKLVGFWISHWYATRNDKKNIAHVKNNSKLHMKRMKKSFRCESYYADQTDLHCTDRETMFEELQDLIRHGKLRPPKVNKVKLEDWKTAVTNAMNSSDIKQLFVMQ
ncbi:Alcohol dehydrogenase GroES and Alcohol dehydrogenase domain containing protein [Dirofilaria immitis]|nr:Alcohol dehydrogenase GroES and Alcohol dehydrogenase domain containing protein [Dirofilaria immitis]